MSPAELLQQLIRFDTTNPQGNEEVCVEFIRSQLAEAGIESELYAKVPDRPNLVARIEGGDKPPLLLQGHVDVVTTSGQDWARPPFSGELVDGYVWGRGAVDMTGPVAGSPSRSRVIGSSQSPRHPQTAVVESSQESERDSSSVPPSSARLTS